MLGRLRVQQKLTLLLMLPLLAVAMMSVPYIVDRVGEAMAASSTVDRAETAREVALLMQDLQEERLLALTYLVSSDAERSDLRLAIGASRDREHRVNAKSRSSADEELRYALAGLGRLKALRADVLKRAGSPVEVDRTYHDLVMSLVTALGLTRQERADVTGLRQMGTFDSLLRINEDITRIGAALVIGTNDPTNAGPLIADTLVRVETDIARFRQQADPDQAAMLALVVQGQTAQRINEYARQISKGGLWVAPAKALTAAEAALMLTRALQERIASDIAGLAADRAWDAKFAAGTVTGFVTLLVLGVILLSAAMSRAIAQPLRRLTTAAASVADLATAELVRVADSEVEESSPPNLVAVPVATSDEIGELARAFNRVQATAAQLMEQQVKTRRNTAVMFANIARRTRSLVSRQLNFIDDLERGERDERKLGKLYRLDHLTTRLHRSADSLLVVSGIREEDRIVEPAKLVDVIRSAVAEIEGYQAVEVGAVCEVMISPELVPDLRLVLAEILENATAFSPPTARVDIQARAEDEVEIVIVDRGIGMTPERLAEENRRLVDRERLDVAPTSVLGLFVVGRLARRHRLRVRLRQGSPQGTIVEIRIPPEFFAEARKAEMTVSGTLAGQARLELPRVPDAGATQLLPVVPVVPNVPGDFAWFGGISQQPALGSSPATGAQRVPSGAFPVLRRPATPANGAPPPQFSGPPAPPEERSMVPSAGPRSGGLVRRTPGDNLRYFGFEASSPLDRPSKARDAEAERDQLDQFTKGAIAAAHGDTDYGIRADAGYDAGVDGGYQASPYPPPPDPRLAPASKSPAPPAGEPTSWATRGPKIPSQRTPYDVPPAASAPPPMPMAGSRGGLTRRVPGQHLSTALRTSAPPSMPRPVSRDAEAERDALQSFLEGLARAEAKPGMPRPTVEPNESE